MRLDHLLIYYTFIFSVILNFQIKSTIYTIFQLLEEYEKDILTTNNPMHRRVEDVITRILKSNDNIKAVSERNWKISVVDDEYTVNALVIPVRNS